MGFIHTNVALLPTATASDYAGQNRVSLLYSVS